MSLSFQMSVLFNFGIFFSVLPLKKVQIVYLFLFFI